VQGSASRRERRRRKAGQLDVARLRKNFADVAEHGDEVPLFFYSDLFIKHPEVRDMFPISMEAQRGHLVDALAKIVSRVDDADELTVFLQGLGRDHRKFGAVTDHYGAVGDSLLATLAHFSGDAWSAELAEDWAGAYQVVASVMTGAAARDEEANPPFWRGKVLSSEQRAYDICVLQVQVEPRLTFVPGQSVAVESPRRPRLWRYYSIANAPREDGTLEFHVRLVDGGAVSMVLTDGQVVGEELRLGSPVGVLTLDSSDRDIVMVAGSTGLAPLKALVEQVAGLAKPRRVHLYFGARTAEELYDLPWLDKMAGEHPWLTAVPVASADARFGGETGPLPDVVARRGSWAGHEAYLAGPTEMVHQAAARLAAAGTPPGQIHVEDFGWSEP
jgi:NAD(P)H-flavin reductase/hemoglobin-like flavoprotein